MKQIIHEDYTSKYVLIDYDRNHGQLLIRGHPNEDLKTNIDIYFKGVLYIDSPIYFDGIQISKVATSRPPLDYVDLPFKHEFLLADKNQRVYRIFAAAMGVFKNQFDSFASSIGHPDFWTEENSCVKWVAENKNID